MSSSTSEAIIDVAQSETLRFIVSLSDRDGDRTVILIVCRLLSGVGRWGLQRDLDRVYSSSLLSVSSSSFSLLWLLEFHC